MIREVLPDRLFIGSTVDTRDLRLLYDNRIAAVMDLALNEPPAQLARDMIYVRVPIIDGDGNSDSIIRTALRCIVTLLENQIRTMIACSAGMSRSPAMAAVAISIVTGRRPEDCLASITANSPHDVSPVLWSRLIAVFEQIVTGGA